MKTITNHHNLPQAVVDAVAGRERPSTRVHYSDTTSTKLPVASVTGLLKPPQATALEQSNDTEMDAADGFFALFGSAIHAVLELAAAHDPDNRIETKMQRPLPDGSGVLLGTSDLIRVDGNTLHELHDYKISSVWEWIYGARDEREEQLNMLLWLAGEEFNVAPDAKLGIVYFFRDWSAREAGEREDYPQAPVQLKYFDVWSREQVEEFIMNRWIEHQAPSPRPCTDNERWMKPGKWRVEKDGNKRALRVVDTEEEAWSWMKWKGLIGEEQYEAREFPPKLYMVKTDDRFIRCEKNPMGRTYCPVAAFCHQANPLSKKG